MHALKAADLVRLAGRPATAKGGRRARDLRFREEAGPREMINGQRRGTGIRQILELRAKRAIGVAGLPT